MMGIVAESACVEHVAIGRALSVAEGQPGQRAGEGGEAPHSPASRTIMKVIARGISRMIWPDDPDVVPQWRIDAEDRARAIGFELPPYRTKAQFDEAVKRCAEREKSRSMVRGPRAAITPDEAASRFAAETDGSFSSDELTAAYEAFCTAHWVACPENFFRAALKLLPNVRRATVVRTSPRRVREVLWVVSTGNRTVSEDAAA